MLGYCREDDHKEHADNQQDNKFDYGDLCDKHGMFLLGS